jgi:hypothetical protein
MTVQIWIVDQNVQYYNMAISKRHQILYAKKPIKVKQVYKLFIFNDLKRSLLIIGYSG